MDLLTDNFIVYYENCSFMIAVQFSVDTENKRELCAIGNLGLVYFTEHLPTSLIAMIGRFYEGLGK